VTVEPRFTPAVLKLAKTIREGVRGLTMVELLALREALGNDMDLPPDIGVREPRRPGPLSGGAAGVPWEQIVTLPSGTELDLASAVGDLERAARFLSDQDAGLAADILHVIEFLHLLANLEGSVD